MAADELTKALLVEEVASPRAIAEALFASVTGGVPMLQALVDSGAATSEVLARYLTRTEAPVLRHVVPIPELVERLPRGLCARLLAVPVRRDAITGTVDIVVADPADPHPASEIAFHLGSPVRVVRAPVAAIEEALRRLRMLSRDDGPSHRFREAAAHAATTMGRTGTDHRRLRGNRDRTHDARPRNDGDGDGARSPITLPPEEPALSQAMPSHADLPPRRGGLVIDTDSAPPPVPRRVRTPPWGTPIHVAPPETEPPRSGYGSEIPIPLTRKTFHPGKIRRGSERPPAPARPPAPRLGEGYAFDATGLRDVVEKAPRPIEPTVSVSSTGEPLGSFIPGPPPLPGMGSKAVGSGVSGPTNSLPGHPPRLPFPEIGSVLAALRNAGSRDEVLDLVLTGARAVAMKVALFVVKKGGYLGWMSTPEFAERVALQSVLIPLDANSIFDRAVREDIYLGPIRYDEVHAPLLRVMRNPTRDVAVVPIRVSGKTAVIIVADELGDTMLGTRRLEELARAGGDAFARIVRTRR